MIEPSPNLLPCDGEVLHLKGFLGNTVCRALSTRLGAEVPWEQLEISMMGRRLLMPRLCAWFGDAAYAYSGIEHQPLPWPTWLGPVRRRLEEACGAPFNSVLLNLYRNGRDSMGWHADDEPELGPNPAIASLSIGATRRFRLKHRRKLHSIGIDLGDGDLLLMRGETQHHWRHALPKTRKLVAARYNLTFRQVRPA